MSKIQKKQIERFNARVCPKCGSRNTYALEYDHTCPEHVDGVSEYVCSDCGTRVGRFSGKILEKGEVEKRPGV